MTDQQPASEHHAPKHSDEPRPNGIDYSAVDKPAAETRTDDDEYPTADEVIADVVQAFEDGDANVEALGAAITFALEQNLPEAYVPAAASALAKAGARQLGYGPHEIAIRGVETACS